MIGADALAGIFAKRPLFFFAVFLTSTVFTALWQPLAGWLLAILISVFFLHWKGLVPAAGFMLLAAVILVNLNLRDTRQQKGEAWISQQGLRSIEAKLLEDARGEKGRWYGIVQLHEMPKYRIIWQGKGEPPPAGTHLKSIGSFTEIRPERNPGVPDKLTRYRAKRVVGIFRASEMRAAQWSSRFTRLKAKVKASFRASLTTGLDKNSQAARVIVAVVTGEKSRDSMELIRLFRESGTLHVFTVSGLHVAIVGTLIWFSLGATGMPRKACVPIIIAAMFTYVWATGAGPAAIRAAWMGTVFLSAFILQRRSDLLNALGAVLLAGLIWDPGILRQPGVQLSYGVVASIGLLAPLVRRCLEWIAVSDKLIPASEIPWHTALWLNFRRHLANVLSVSLAASIGSIPLSAFHFSIISPVSVIASVILVLQAHVLLGLGLMSALISPIYQPASIFINKTNAVVAESAVSVASAFSEIPGAWLAPQKILQEKLIIYDLPYGNSAACFTAPKIAGTLIDTGGEISFRSQVAPSLKNLGIYPDSIIFSHGDAGHIAPAALVQDTFQIKQIALGMKKISASIASTWSDSALEIRKIPATAGSVFPIKKGVYFEVWLSPHETPLAPKADNQVMVGMLHWHGWRLLFLSDAGRLSEKWLLEHRDKLHADGIICGFHETDHSLTPDFLDQVSPKVIVLPRMPGSKMDSARTALIPSLKKRGIKIIDQAESGGVSISRSGNELHLKSFLTGETKILVF